MERIERLPCKILTWCIFFISAGCTIENPICTGNSEDIKFTFSATGYHTRAAASYEDCISDMNLIIFRNGRLESIIWQEYGTTPDTAELTARLVSGESYSFYAIANIGHKISYEEGAGPEKLVIDIMQASGYGIPMSSVMENISIDDAEDIHIRLTRMMAKISLRIDRSHLNENIDIEVTGVRLCNCPRYATIIGSNRTSSRHDCLPDGPALSSSSCAALNQIGHNGLSNEVSIYMLENMQGRFPYDISEDEEKIFDEEDIMSKICSFMEIEMKYRSKEHFTDKGKLIYRHYLGGSMDNLDIERNCHYHITVTPENDGLNGSGWRTDKTAIGTFVHDISLSADKIDMNYRGQTVMLEAKISPDEATYKELIWESSDTMIAEISEEGLVTAINEGRCIIRCTASDGSGCESRCLVTVEYAQPYFNIYPADYIEGHVGEELHIWCEVFPPNTPFDPGYEELEFDKSRGIYDYKTDPDGHGVTLTLLKPGIGIVYMSAGEPVNESGMVIVRILP